MSMYSELLSAFWVL